MEDYFCSVSNFWPVQSGVHSLKWGVLGKGFPFCPHPENTGIGSFHPTFTTDLLYLKTLDFCKGGGRIKQPMWFLLAMHSAVSNGYASQSLAGYHALIWLSGGSLLLFINELGNVMILSSFDDLPLTTLKVDSIRSLCLYLI